ncbi:MAG: hypothetical protein QOK04_2466, partial [Solirubrobacteraceae bacterium]|nr:hypothetical protein [Solirubrobacteraceae bacterium]
MLVAGPASAKHPNSPEVQRPKTIALDVGKKDGGGTGPTRTSKSKGDDGSRGNGRGNGGDR